MEHIAKLGVRHQCVGMFCLVLANVQLGNIGTMERQPALMILYPAHQVNITTVSHVYHCPRNAPQVDRRITPHAVVDQMKHGMDQHVS